MFVWITVQACLSSEWQREMSACGNTPCSLYSRVCRFTSSLLSYKTTKNVFFCKLRMQSDNSSVQLWYLCICSEPSPAIPVVLHTLHWPYASQGCCWAALCICACFRRGLGHEVSGEDAWGLWVALERWCVLMQRSWTDVLETDQTMCTSVSWHICSERLLSCSSVPYSLWLVYTSASLMRTHFLAPFLTVALNYDLLHTHTQKEG